MRDFIKNNKLKILILLIIILLLLLITIFNRNIIINRFRAINKESENEELQSKIDATYEIKEENEQEKKILIQFSSTVENIEYIIMPDETKIDIENSKKQLSIDYQFLTSDQGKLKFKIKITNEEEKEYILRMNAEPIIKLGEVEQYPILTSDGVKNINRDIEIDSTREAGYKTYYSIDNGQNWKEYTQIFNVGLDTNNIVTKEVNENVNEILIQPKKEWNYNNEIASDAIQIEAYDGKDETFEKMNHASGTTTRYMLVDDSIKGYEVRIKWWNWTYGGYYSKIYCLDESGNTILEYTLSSGQSHDQNYYIPENTVKIKYYVRFPDNPSYSPEDGYGKMFEIQPASSIKTKVETQINSIILECSTIKMKGNIQYNYYIKKSDEDEYILKAENITDSSYTFENLIDFTKYDVKIVVKDEDGNEYEKTETQKETLKNGKNILDYIASNEVDSSGYNYSLSIAGIEYHFDVTYLTPQNVNNYNATYNSSTNTYTVGDLSIGTANPYEEGKDGIQKMAVLKCNGNLNVTGTITTNTYETTSDDGITGNVTKVKGLMIYCSGILTNNGTITQTARGTCDTKGENVYLYLNNDDTYEYVPAVGGNGGATNSAGYYANVNKGSKSSIIRGTRRR